MRVAVAMAVVMASSSTALAQRTVARPGHREVALNPDAGTHQEEVRGAPFTLTTLIFPEGFGQAVACGNCTQATGPAAENWYLQLAPEQNAIYLKPTRLPDAAHPAFAFNTTVHVILVSGYRIAVNLGLADINSAAAPDAEVAFTLPKRAQLSGKLAEETAKLESSFKERLESASLDHFLGFLLGELRCDGGPSRPFQTDKVYLRIVQVCFVDSSPRTYWTVFEVTNRSSGQVEIGSANLTGGAGDGDSKHAFKVERTSLRFNDRAKGIAVVQLGGEQSAPAEWTLEVGEEGGEQRKIAAKGLRF